MVPSTWQPAQWQRYCPLGAELDPTTGIPKKITWACFEPSVQPDNGRGTPGLLVYHIHEVTIEAIGLPSSVLRDLRQRQRAWEAARVPNLELLPTLEPAIRREIQLLSRDAQLALATGAGVVVIGIFCVLAAPVVVPIMVNAGALVARAAVVAAEMRSLWALAQGFATALAQVANSALRNPQPAW